MQAKSIAECIQQYFRPLLSYHFIVSILIVLHIFYCAYTIFIGAIKGASQKVGGCYQTGRSFYVHTHAVWTHKEKKLTLFNLLI